MSIDLSKVKVGDTLVIRAQVKQIDLGDTRLRFRVAGNGLESSWIPNETVVGHEPRGLKVDDRVRHCWTGSTGVVRHVEGLRAAWKPDNGDLSLCDAAYLDRID